ncbi:glycosyltransferase family 39 protein [Fomitopsis serialis]|uniref:glycosyltransferase family 39 protein n=1 Tax=Fomitopsis serialis TaxID=139415 RepID=UPI00200775E0|nr:glycosyltransferase family 39 protein [Neoantrodia serialis]KAH9930672.1 glycosyltransferase family 39 protein [Neoantrodia serialis]
MRPSQIVIHVGTPPEHSPRSSSDFEEIQYPVNQSPSWSTRSAREEELPLHYMSEETARRRVLRGPSGNGTHQEPSHAPEKEYEIYDDEGKDVYAKMKDMRSPLGSGRLRRPPPPPPTTVSEFFQQNLEHIPPIAYTLLSCWTRFHRIGHSPLVIWDEAHFGNASLLSGYDGHFDFTSGASYSDNVPYVAMRVMLATFGVALVPLAWYTAVELGMSWRACHLAAIMVLLDVGWLCISRFILLDSMLLFFTFSTVFCLAKFHNQQYQSFSFDWWLWLAMTGASIGCVTSVKWVGMFVTALVGLYTIEDLWEKFGDLRMTTREQMRHWGARITCLITLPLVLYMAFFKIHFMILNHSGPDDAKMSSLFQANLIGNTFSQNPLNMGWAGGLLHSHVQTYPVARGYNPEGPIRFLADGDVIRFQHVATKRNLHSHPIPAPVSKLNNEVAGYGDDKIGDFQDYWVVEVQGPCGQIHSLTTRLRLRHQALGCYLRAGNEILPQWGFKQIEVSCDKENNPSDIYTYWNVETHINERLPPGNAQFYKTSFMRDFWHLNVAMMTTNNALIPDPDKEDILASKPLDWPFLRLGLRMCGWGANQSKYYLLGTPVIWWGSTLSLFVAVAALGIYMIRKQRKYVDMEPREWDHMVYVGKVAVVGWALHFVPFLIMGRVTYLHHYLPTLYFAVLTSAHVLDHFVFTTRRLSERTKWIVFAVIVTAIVGTFWWFRGVAFGIDDAINDHWGLKWRSTWNMYEE